MTFEKFDKLTESEARTFVLAKAKRLLRRARRLDDGAWQRTFGKAPDLLPVAAETAFNRMLARESVERQSLK